MMGPVGDQMLRIIGREPAPQGIIEAAATAGGDRGDRGRRSPLPIGASAPEDDDADEEDEGAGRVGLGAARLADARDDAALARPRSADIVWGV